MLGQEVGDQMIELPLQHEDQDLVILTKAFIKILHVEVRSGLELPGVIIDHIHLGLDLQEVAQV